MNKGEYDHTASEKGLKQIGADIMLESRVDDLKGHQAKKPNLIP